MTRVKNTVVRRARVKKVLKAAKGYFGSKHRLYKTAKEQVMHSRVYAYRDRRNKKRDFRKLWIIRINAACREFDMSYSKFISGLTKANIEINRKMLSEVAINDPKAFEELIKASKEALEGHLKDKQPVKKAVKKKDKTEDVSKMSVADLKILAKKKGIANYSKMLKAELIKELSE